jgi:2-polyprenyl-6-methoxyphenol hydroxylase-like FAD-dependent oxidoreductase
MDANYSEPQIEKTPFCVDWRLVDLELRTWISSGGHICLIGDAAHPLPPTSIQGCSQAIEDGVALATLLSLSHHDGSVKSGNKIPIALQVFERLRRGRVTAARRHGEEIRKRWHQAKGISVRENPECIRLPRPDWLLNHKCELFIRGM